MRPKIRPNGSILSFFKPTSQLDPETTSLIPIDSTAAPSESPSQLDPETTSLIPIDSTAASSESPSQLDAEKTSLIPNDSTAASSESAFQRKSIITSTVRAAVSFFMLIAWQCLADTRPLDKNVLYAQFFATKEVLEQTAQLCLLAFAPGLLEICQSATPPTIEWLKRLPTSFKHRWGVYAIILEKRGHRPRLYVGSGTNTHFGVAVRLQQYDLGNSLPVLVEQSLNEGFKITHKGLLCWIPTPSGMNEDAARLLILLLEATMAYMLWALKKSPGDFGVYMGHLCPWAHNTLEYDGACTHVCLTEGLRGNFHLPPEKREEFYAVRAERKTAKHNEVNSNWHFKQMAENYDEYITNSTERVYRSRANNPGRDAQHQVDRHQKAKKDKTFWCEVCSEAHSSQLTLDNHYKSQRHKRKLEGRVTPFRCIPCDLYFPNKSNLTRHTKSAYHQVNTLSYESNPEHTAVRHDPWMNRDRISVRR